MDKANQIKTTTISTDPWVGLKQFTSARIALGKVGTAIPLQEILAFKMAHAHARDAVHSELDLNTLSTGISNLQLSFYILQSKATTRQTYLKRPDLGRQLATESIDLLSVNNKETFDISITMADGLSATAINNHAIDLLKSLLLLLKKDDFTIAPICLAKQARVAIADEIGSLQKAKLSLILIGERPGLGAADSMGAYLTYAPKPGLTDNNRNCISNIRPEGFAIEMAANKIYYFVKASFQLQLSGVTLKDESHLLGS